MVDEKKGSTPKIIDIITLGVELKLLSRVKKTPGAAGSRAGRF